MNEAIDSISSRLAKPGAGLPRFELFVARRIFSVSKRLTSRAGAEARLAREGAAALRLARACDPAAAAERVLIPRPRGLEDSSRHWSVFMTLDHLRIVNEAIAQTIRSLGVGRSSPRVLGTADVKPSPGADAGVLAAFENSCRAVAEAAGGLPDLKTKSRYAHPWFGPLDAAGWHFMAGFHVRLHRGQLEQIIARLPAGGAASTADASISRRP
jgi:hypothetical protein